VRIHGTEEEQEARAAPEKRCGPIRGFFAARSIVQSEQSIEDELICKRKRATVEAIRNANTNDPQVQQALLGLLTPDAQGQ